MLLIVIYTVEFQKKKKKGFPHAYIVLFLHQDNKIPTLDDIYRIIFAKIPDRQTYTNLYDLVKEYTMHGLCGNANRNSPCMVNKRCSKYFPKDFNEKTYMDEDGYPVYT